jgi:hypothetical protein
MYYICGEMLMDLDRELEAKDWFLAGIDVASKQGEDKTLRELEGALANCDD